MTIAMDPPVSEAQRRAMFAAAAGHSTLGIPKKVGEEFVGKDADGKHAAGIIFVAPDGDVLLLLRSSAEANYAGHWALPGGNAEEGESPEEAADREAREEIGQYPAGERRLVDRKTTPTGMTFHTFAQSVPEKFAPTLNGEHSEYAWASKSALPQPLHPAVAATLKKMGSDEAPFREEYHPRSHGQFTSGGGSSGGSSGGESEGEMAKPASKTSVGEKLKTHAATFQKYGKDAAEFVRSGEATKVLSRIVTDPRNLSFALQSVLSHGTTALHHVSGGIVPQIEGLDPSTWHLNEQMFDHVVHQFADSAGVTAGKAKGLMRKAVQGLIAQRDAMSAGPKAQFTTAKDEDPKDGIDQALEALLDLLGDEEDDDKPEGGETDKPAAAHDARMAADAMAFDRDSVREYDRDGRMRVAVANISKANICPYLGSEIPGAAELGLDPNKVYRLLRDPEELAKAAPTFNGIQILKKHTPVSADDHKPYDVIGSTGTDAAFVDPYLQNSLTFWANEGGIDAINSNEKKQLSCGYHYRADMTPGTFGGENFDGIMRDLVGNHVSLVSEGRAGDDVAVGDSIESIQWTMIAQAMMLL